MGRVPRRRQARLARKLLRIRKGLGLSQNKMLTYMGLEQKLGRTSISSYEQSHREPPLYVLLKYARAAGICLDVLVDDDLDLPGKLPSVPKHDVAKHRSTIPLKR